VHESPIDLLGLDTHLHLQPHIRGLPNKILLMIAAGLDGKAIIALRESCSNLHNRLQRTFLEFNIEHQNSNLLHLAAETNNRSLAKAMLRCHADVNAFFRGKTPIMRALKSGATDVLRALLRTPGVCHQVQHLPGGHRNGTCPSKFESGFET
jgi:ankyrin repeat protein